MLQIQKKSELYILLFLSLIKFLCNLVQLLNNCKDKDGCKETDTCENAPYDVEFFTPKVSGNLHEEVAEGC